MNGLQQTSTSYEVQPGGALNGNVKVPGDKSISHRALLLAAIARGTSRIRGVLRGEDCLATLEACRSLGVEIEWTADGTVQVQGAGLHGLKQPDKALDFGNSGTALRLATGLLAGQGFPTVLVGDESLSKRPMRRVTDPLSLMGAEIQCTEAGTAPLRIHGRPLTGIDYRLPVASAQVKSAVLLAGLYAAGQTRVAEPVPTRDHTERMLQTFGYEVRCSDGLAMLNGGEELQAGCIDVPADISSAAFFLVGASIAPGSDLVLEQVGMNPTRTGVISILRNMGARIDVLDEGFLGAEPVARLRVRGTPLRGIQVPETLVASAIDEFPVLFVAAACAEGETRVSGAAELRVKESDRIASMAVGLERLGVFAAPTADGIVIEGGPVGGGEIDSHGDHRVAMAFAMAALRANGAVRILNCANVATSFPGFVDLAAAAGLRISR